MTEQIIQKNAAPLCMLTYKPPFPWSRLLSFFDARGIPGIERVEYDKAGKGVYMRTVRLPHEGKEISGWMSVCNCEAKQALALTVPERLYPVLPQIEQRVRQLFDLDADPEVIYQHLIVMDELKPGLNLKGVRVPGAFDSFEMAVRAILGQQVTIKAARTLANRLVIAQGRQIETSLEGLTRVFPDPEGIASLPEPVGEVLGPLGITRNRCRAIRSLAEALVSGKITLAPHADQAVQMERLLALPGVGPWTAHYIALRALKWTDAFPHTDYGVKLAFKQAGGLDDYPSPKEILAQAEAWRPWRSYATLNLWESLS